MYFFTAISSDHAVVSIQFPSLLSAFTGPLAMIKEVPLDVQASDLCDIVEANTHDKESGRIQNGPTSLDHNIQKEPTLPLEHLHSAPTA